MLEACYAQAVHLLFTGYPPGYPLTIHRFSLACHQAYPKTYPQAWHR